MIRAGTLTKPSPQQALAATLGGTILGPDAILVDGHLIVASIRGVVRADGRAIGMWSEGADVLAARFAAVTS